jgi:NADPH-dependent curcumin reductase CurA
MFCGFTRKGRNVLRRLGVSGIAAIVLLGLSIGSMTACTGLSPIAAPKGNYTVTVNAVGSGNVNTSAQVQLTVQ